MSDRLMSEAKRQKGIHDRAVSGTGLTLDEFIQRVLGLHLEPWQTTALENRERVLCGTSEAAREWTPGERITELAREFGEERSSTREALARDGVMIGALHEGNQNLLHRVLKLEEAERCRSEKSGETPTAAPAGASSLASKSASTTPPKDSPNQHDGAGVGSAELPSPKFPFRMFVSRWVDGEWRDGNWREAETEAGPWFLMLEQAPMKPLTPGKIEHLVGTKHEFISEALIERIKREVRDQVNHELDTWEGNSYVAKYDDKLKLTVNNAVDQRLKDMWPALETQTRVWVREGMTGIFDELISKLR